MKIRIYQSDVKDQQPSEGQEETRFLVSLTSDQLVWDQNTEAGWTDAVADEQSVEPSTDSVFGDDPFDQPQNGVEETWFSESF